MAGGFIRSLVLILAAAVASPVQAAAIAVFGENSNDQVTSFLNANGHIAKNFGILPPDDLSSFQVVVALRKPGNDAVKQFVLDGGLLITEWNAAGWALDVANLLDADAGGIASLGLQALISITDAGLALGLGKGLGNPYNDGERTSSHSTLLNIGNGVDVLGTGPLPALQMLAALSDPPPFPAVTIGGNSGKGYTLVNALDWADIFPTTGSPSGQWLLNAVNVRQVQPVPEPDTLALAALALTCLVAARRRRTH